MVFHCKIITQYYVITNIIMYLCSNFVNNPLILNKTMLCGVSLCFCYGTVLLNHKRKSYADLLLVFLFLCNKDFQRDKEFNQAKHLNFLANFWYKKHFFGKRFNNKSKRNLSRMFFAKLNPREYYKYL